MERYLGHQFGRAGVAMNGWGIIGWLAVITSTVQFIPQVSRIITTKNTQGVSKLFWVFLAAQSAAWIVYGYILALYQILVINCVVFVASFVVWMVLHHFKRLWLNCFVMPISQLALAFAVLILAGTTVIGNIALLGSIFAWLPQAYTAVVRRDVSGLSPLSWVLVLLSSVAWMLYGHGVSEWRVQIPALSAASVAVIVLIRIVQTRTTATKNGSQSD